MNYFGELGELCLRALYKTMKHLIKKTHLIGLPLNHKIRKLLHISYLPKITIEKGIRDVKLVETLSLVNDN